MAKRFDDSADVLGYHLQTSWPRFYSEDQSRRFGRIETRLHYRLVQMAIDMEEKKRPGAINGMIKTLLEDIPSDWIRCHVISGMICALICLSKETLFHPANLKYLEDARTMLKWEISQSILSTRTYTHK